eukprot:m.37969 g.37969  ORF g.37969 m.37969 type:complete len:65 (-) comp11142_c0_seq4:184-378(-)
MNPMGAVAAAMVYHWCLDIDHDIGRATPLLCLRVRHGGWPRAVVFVASQASYSAIRRCGRWAET